MLPSPRTLCESTVLLVLLDADIQFRQIVGMIVSLEKFLTDAEERGNDFFLGLLEKQHVRMKALFERRVVRSS